MHFLLPSATPSPVQVTPYKDRSPHRGGEGSGALHERGGRGKQRSPPKRKVLRYVGLIHDVVMFAGYVLASYPGQVEKENMWPGYEAYIVATDSCLLLVWSYTVSGFLLL